MKPLALIAVVAVAGGQPTLTRHVPARIVKTCKVAGKGALVPVRCVRLVPKGPLEPYPFAVQGGLWSGRRLYEIDVGARVSARPFDTELHWIFGGGTAAEVALHVLSDAQNEVRGKPRLVARSRVGALRFEVYRFPPPPAGGPNGGHVAAFAHLGSAVYFVSVHGYEHQTTAVRMLAAMLPS